MKPIDLPEILMLINTEAQESATLEFKAGDALDRSGGGPRELVKDITGMANGAGGRLIYGIGERKVEGRTVADGPFATRK
jgi:predicted HTH transcriptional regulator